MGKIDVYNGQGPVGHNPNGYGVHREPQLPDDIRHGLPNPYAFNIPIRSSGACPNILGK